MPIRMFTTSRPSLGASVIDRVCLWIELQRAEANTTMLRIVINTAIVLAFFEAYLASHHIDSFIASNHPGYAIACFIACLIAKLIQLRYQKEAE
jgi:hypothetical protein